MFFVEHILYRKLSNFLVVAAKSYGRKMLIQEYQLIDFIISGGREDS